MAYYNGSLFAAWQDDSSGADEIYAASWNGSSWVAAGTGANTGGGVSNTDGIASQPELAASPGGLYLLWLDNRIVNLSGNTVAPYVKQWNGSSFVEQVVGDASYRGIGDAVGSPTSPALAVDSAGQPFAAWADTASGDPQIYVRGNTFALNTVHYVNDSSQESDAFTTAVGSSSHDGLTPGTPKSSVSDVFNDPSHVVQSGDLIYIDSGSYPGFTLTSAANGVILWGFPKNPTIIQGSVEITGASNVTLQNIVFDGGLTLTNCTNVHSVELHRQRHGHYRRRRRRKSNRPQPHLRIRHRHRTDRWCPGTVIEHNQIEGAAEGLAITGANVTGLVVRSINSAGALPASR